MGHYPVMPRLKSILVIALVLSIAILIPSIYANTVIGGFVPTGGPTGAGYDDGNLYGYAFQLPTTIISSNPYGGNTGNFSLLNAIAIKYGIVTAVVWFYQPSNGQGGLLEVQNAPITGHPTNNVPWLYVGTNGSLFAGDWLYYYPPPQVITGKLPVGWHMAVVEEYASSSKYYLNLYLDGKYIGTADLFYTSSYFLPGLFGATPNFGGLNTYPFAYIGGGFTDWPAGKLANFFYNGTIAIVAFYNSLLSGTTIAEMRHYSMITSNGISVYLPTEGLIVAYVLSPSFFNANTGTLRPYYVNQTALRELGISNPNLLLVAYGENLKSSIWADYSITINTSIAAQSGLPLIEWMVIIVLVVIVIVAAIALIFWRKRR